MNVGHNLFEDFDKRCYQYVLIDYLHTIIMWSIYFFSMLMNAGNQRFLFMLEYEPLRICFLGHSKNFCST